MSYPTLSSASDVWSLRDVYKAAAGGDWPTIAWSVNLSNVTYDSVSFSISSQDTNPNSLVFNNDGTKMYLVGSINDRIYQYTLSTAFDVSTASYDSVSLSLGAQDVTPIEMVFNTDGTKMFYLGFGGDRVYQYSLSSAFDISTASYDSISFSITAQESLPMGLAFSNDGTKMFVTGESSDSVHQYTLSTGYDLSTVSYDSVAFSVSSQDTEPRSITFNEDGTAMYIVGDATNSVYQYSLSTAYDLSTASYASISLDVSSQDTGPFAIAFNNNGTKMYIVGRAADKIYQYSTGL